MSTAAGAAKKLDEKTRGLTKTVTDPLGDIAKSLVGKAGVSDPSTQRGLGGALAGGGVFGSTGAFFRGQKEGEIIEEERRQAERDEDKRQLFNEDIFNLAQSFGGRVAQTPSFDFENLAFQGDDPRGADLNRLINIFSRRSSEVLNQRVAPGLSQTRLSLVE